MKKAHAEFVAMTTPCVVELYGVEESVAAEAFVAVQQNTRRLEKKYNYHDPLSMLSRIINRRASGRVEVDEETAAILQTVRQLSIDTAGCFDITMGTIQECYRQKSREALQRCLEARQSWYGLEVWEIRDRILSFQSPHTRIDLGGVIKEYAVDEAVRLLKARGIGSALVNFGGDVRVIGKKPDGRLFGVAIKNPKQRDAILAVVNIEDQALTTSGSYERVHRVGDGVFSHILSPKVVSGEILSATMIGSNALFCGVYSTAFMLDTEMVIPDGLQVMLIDRELRLHQNILP